MTSDWRVRQALERRYDGPVPPGASVPPDVHASSARQARNRCFWAWRSVRRIGHRVLDARRAFHAAPSVAGYREWARLRRDLAWALSGWADCRDRMRRVESGRRRITRPRRSARRRPSR